MPIVFKLGDEKNLRFSGPRGEVMTEVYWSLVSGKRKLLAHLASKSIAVGAQFEFYLAAILDAIGSILD